MIGVKEIIGLVALMLVTFLIFISPLGNIITDHIAAFSSNSATDEPTNIGHDNMRANFNFCSNAPRINCVVDGDTFWYDGRKIRIADIDTAEISRPKCPAEKRLGLRAKTRLFEILNAGNFSLQRVERDKDYFGRDLRIIMRGGNSIGDILIAEGLAHKWIGRKQNWC